MNNKTSNDEPKKPSKEEGLRTVETIINDNAEAPVPPALEDELVKHFKDRDTARSFSELLQGKISLNYIDNRSGGVFFSSEAHITGDVIGRGQVKQTLRQTGETYSEIIACRVLGEDLDKTRNVYIKTILHDHASRILREQQILILWGQAHWGKRTAALHLLSTLQTGEILEVRPDVVLDDIPSFEVVEKKGYLIDTLAPDSAQKLSPTLINRLSEQHFRKKGSYLVITVDSRVSLPKTALSNNLLTWNKLPDKTQLLQAHLDWHLTDQDKLSQALELSNTKEVQQFLSAHLLPGEVGRLAELLTSVVCNELKLDEALSRFESHASKQVEEWFENHTELEKRTFMISLAVLSGASYQSVANADEQLQFFIKSASDKKESSDSNFVFGSRSQRVQESCAHFSQGYEETEFGLSPIEILELDNPIFQPAVLRYVWNEYDRLRKPLVAWLRDLGIQTSSDVCARAAAAVGELSKYNFGHIKEEILLPWANHQDKQARAAAAFAFGIPAWEGEFAPQVLGLLHHWSTLRNNWRLNWTAASAYGGLVGLRFPVMALRDLHNVAQAKDLRLFAVLNRSVLNLTNAGQVEPDYYFKALDALISWTSPPTDRIVALIGVLIFLNLALEAKIEAVPDTDKWPTLLWLSQEDVTYQNKIILLLRRALNTKLTRKPALETLRQLLQVADRDARLYPPIERIVRGLVIQGVEREQDRVRHYLKRWAAESKEVSPSAERLLTNIENA